MRRSLALVAALLASMLLVPATAAVEAPDEASDIVLVLDFSGSILEDEAIRTDFADALDGIAARVAETADRLVAGDATVSIVTFATRAADLTGCTGLQLRENQPAVAALADCLRRVAATYRNGPDPALTNQIGDDTNYVAAMERAAAHLPAGSARPAIIFFTDGRHEVGGVPVADVVPARDRLFGDRSPFGLLPVGMGVDPADRPVLEAGLVDLRITRDLERCEGGALDWPEVVFETAEAAGQAVGLALQDVSCTFTVEPTPPASASPTPEPPAPVTGISLRPGDSVIDVTWTAPSDADTAPVEDYLVRCRPSNGGDWIESTEGVSTETEATVSGLANGAEYTCEVAAVRASGAEAWSSAAGAVVPFGRPPAPAKPTVLALDAAARVGVTMPADAPVSGFQVECSADGGGTWPVEEQVDGARAAVDVSGLTNGTEYVCRAFATNASGLSDASPLSDVFRPCGGPVDCNPVAAGVFGGLLLALLGVLLVALWRWYAGRKVYVTAQVDRFPTVTLGRGPSVGLTFVRRGPAGRITEVVPAEGRRADVRIRYAGGVDFVVRAARSRLRTRAGRQVEITDSQGQTHSLVVRAFDEPPQPLRRSDDDGA